MSKIINLPDEGGFKAKKPTVTVKTTTTTTKTITLTPSDIFEILAAALKMDKLKTTIDWVFEDGDVYEATVIETTEEAQP